MGERGGGGGGNKQDGGPVSSSSKGRVILRRGLQVLLAGRVYKIRGTA